MNDLTPHVTIQARYDGALTLDQFVAQATANHDLWATFAKRAVPEPDLLARVNRLSARRHLLVLLEDWCGDAVNTIPALAALAAASDTVDLRILTRDANLDLMDAHLTGGTRSIPVVIVLDESYHERGWWGPRPAPLQSWVRSEGQVLEKSARYREVRRWYARDRARTTLSEIVELLDGSIAAQAA
ncbi:MAG: thioredoxin family protein [Gemmatimonadota bacterium]